MILNLELCRDNCRASFRIKTKEVIAYMFKGEYEF